MSDNEWNPPNYNYRGMGYKLQATAHQCNKLPLGPSVLGYMGYGVILWTLK
jgi:hypothetical protein